MGNIFSRYPPKNTRVVESGSNLQAAITAAAASRTNHREAVAKFATITVAAVPSGYWYGFSDGAQDIRFYFGSAASNDGAIFVNTSSANLSTIASNLATAINDNLLSSVTVNAAVITADAGAPMYALAGTQSSALTIALGTGSTVYVRANKWATPGGTQVRAAPGTYTGNILLHSGTLIQCTGAVTIDGTLKVLDEDSGFQGPLTVTGAVTHWSELFGFGGVAGQADEGNCLAVAQRSSDDGGADKVIEVDAHGLIKMFGLALQTAPDPSENCPSLPEFTKRGVSAILDRPLPAMRLTNAKALMSYTVDGNNLTMWTTTDAILGGVSPLDYAAAAGVPVTFATIAGKTGDASYLSVANVQAFIGLAGGAVACKTMSDTAGHDGRTKSFDIADYEVRQAIDKIERDYNYTVNAFVSSANWTAMEPVFAGNTPEATRMLRQLCTVVRDVYANNLALSSYTFPVQFRYPPPIYDLSARPDSQAWWASLMKILRNSAGIVYMFWDTGFGSTAAQKNAWKDRIDLMATAMQAGDIMILPPDQCCFTAPTYPTNHIPNGGFEASEIVTIKNRGTAGQNWIVVTTGVGSSIAPNAVEYHSGVQSCKMIRTTNACSLQYAAIWVAQWETYELSLWAKAASGSVDVAVTGGITAGPWTFTPGASWARFARNIAVPIGSRNLTLTLTPSQNTTIYIDDVALI